MKKYSIMDEILKTLNEKQKEAVLTTEGPILILAGAGSGKTKCLTHRIAYLIAQGIAPENILAVTFTNKAAQEMENRINSLLIAIGSTGHKPYAISNMPFIGTFHSFCVRILRENSLKAGFTKTFSIFDDGDSLSLIKEVINELAINQKQFPAGMVCKVISNLKNELINPDEYSLKTGNEYFATTLHKIYELYQKRLTESNALDFDDLIMKTVELFRDNQEILEKYQNRFHYINVDEYQDTNHAQYVLIKLLAEKNKNLAVVGDDAQAIYGFRGADFQNILNFEKDWPQAKIVVLDENYRSTQNVLDAAHAVISHNTLQKEKKLWTKNEKGEEIEILFANDEREESKIIMEKIKSLFHEGFLPKDLAVLFRTNAQTRVLEEALINNNFPYKIIGGVKFYERKEVKDIIAYLRVIFNPGDSLSLKRIINIPARGIGKVLFLKYLAKSALNAGEQKKIFQFENIIKELKEKTEIFPASEFIKFLVKKINYESYLKDFSDEAENRWENVKELFSLAKKYDELEPKEGLEKMLEDISLVSDQDEIKDEKNVLHLMTIHAAKGLEFPFVFIAGMEEGIFPHSRSLMNPRELEEERRLCYVALTRAKKKIFMTLASKRLLFGSIQANPPSRFLGELPERLIIKHGEINDSEDDLYYDDEDE